jgi:hypothetical protein
MRGTNDSERTRTRASENERERERERARRRRREIWRGEREIETTAERDMEGGERDRGDGGER